MAKPGGKGKKRSKKGKGLYLKYRNENHKVKNKELKQAKHEKRVLFFQERREYSLARRVYKSALRIIARVTPPKVRPKDWTPDLVSNDIVRISKERIRGFEEKYPDKVIKK